MNKQLQWLKELITKKPKEYFEFFYIDIQHYFDLRLEPEDFKNDIRKLFRICCNYTEKLFVCTSKKEVKKWLDDIALDITHNLEVDYLIENFICNRRKYENNNSEVNETV